MKNIFLTIISGFILSSISLGQSEELKTNMIEVLTDTIFIKKQRTINHIDSRKLIPFNLPENTIQWGYYFESIDKYDIDKALSRKYFKAIDFVEDSLRSKKGVSGKYPISVRKIGPVKLEVLILDKTGKDKYVKNENGICLIQRPEEYLNNESTLCEVGKCYSSKKLTTNNILKGEYFMGFRNIDYRDDAYIVLQIIAIVK